MSQPIRNASTLVLARETSDGFEVFLSKRTAKAAFLASAYVYPGGRVDDADHDLSIPVHGLETCGTFEDTDDTKLFRAHVVALLRECFEEAGVLLARDADGSVVELHDQERLASLAEKRAALNAGTTTFAAVLGAEKLTLDAVGLDYFAHWITPPFESRRFDTRFFFAVAPAGQEPVPDYSEMVHGQWFAAQDALDAYIAGEIQLAPPTLCTLEDLAGCTTLADALAWAAAEVPTPILPRLETINDTMHLLLPGDPLYGSENPVVGPTRVVLRNGKFSREYAS
ncbi:MAG: 8-oxo-dGTP pyrophosphatase MutT (NUDIX family) [Bradymonadia bacterium]